MKLGKPRRIRVPVRYVDGNWECALGGGIPVENGTEAELIVDAGDIADKTFLQALDTAVKHKVLGEGSAFLIALTVKQDAPPTPALAASLIRFHTIRWNLASEFLDSFNPATLCFIRVTLSKPGDRQIKTLNSRDGGLWLVTQGLRTTEIISTTVTLPEAVSQEPATSLNHALTKLSEAYETWRISHTGNVYDRVFYQAKDGRWYPLKVLRSATIEDQAHAIGGQLWDEFMKKMLALRDAPKRK